MTDRGHPWPAEHRRVDFTDIGTLNDAGDPDADTEQSVTFYLTEERNRRRGASSRPAASAS